MNKSKKIKLFMIITGIIIGIILVTFMILNHYIFNFRFLLALLCCFIIIIIWVLVNYIGIKIILNDKEK